MKIKITSLNSKGDGVAEGTQETYVVPFSLPGEEIEFASAEPLKPGVCGVDRYERLTDSPHRRVPPCPYFGACGGCQLQHMTDDFYANYKGGLLAEDLAVHDIVASEGTCPQMFGPGNRRRINFKVMRVGQGVALGYHQRRSHKVLDINACPLLTQKLQDLIAPFKALFKKILQGGDKLNLFLTEALNGFDVLMDFETAKSFSFEEMGALIAMAQNYKLIRVTLKTPRGEELLYEAEKPRVAFQGIYVAIPPNPFLQPSEISQDKMIQTVMDLMPKNAKKVADLFSGLGTFSVPLSARMAVDAYEQNPQAVKFLKETKKLLPGKIEAFERDLFKNPLTVQELENYDCVVLDPPRAGAVAQIKNLAASKVSHVIMISCNTHTFARDAHLLIKGGYKMESLKVFDQFLWSVHLEMIALFKKV
ncbi:MAG: methyltransferase [Alphaproteobacteria bacterium]